MSARDALTIDRNAEGAWRISAFIDERDGFGEFLKTETFYGYSRSEAVSVFLARWQEVIA